MKEKLFSDQQIKHCPLCHCDEFLISDSGSMLCAQCGSFFENVRQIVVSTSFSQRPMKYIMQPSSMIAH